MEEQQKFDLIEPEVAQQVQQVVEDLQVIASQIQFPEKISEAIEKIQEVILKPWQEQQTPIVWCGGITDSSHDITICLVPIRINQLFKDKPHPLTKLKVHSSRLSKFSMYFETCLTERWKKQTSLPSDMEFVLETHTDIACYTDCFSRMYKPPFFKDFKDVKYSLGLLQVALQIQFLELIDSISLYLSSKTWSDTEDMAIRMFSTGHNFPRNHAQDLVVRLGMDESKEEIHKQLCDLIKHSIQSALAYDGNFRFYRAFFKDMLPGSLPGSPAGIGQGNGSSSPSSNAFGFGSSNGSSNEQRNGFSNGASSRFGFNSNCMKDVVRIVCREAKNMVVKIAKECEGKTYLLVPSFAEKIMAVCWILETLLAAKVAEEFVQCFVHLNALFKILASIEDPTDANMSDFNEGEQLQYRSRDRRARRQYAFVRSETGEATNAGVELARLVFVVYQEVAAGNLLLITRDRIALLENWHLLSGKLLVGTNCNFDQATKDLFMPLPLKHQLELSKLGKASNDWSYESYISASSLAKLVKKQWPTVEVKCVPSPLPSW